MLQKTFIYKELKVAYCLKGRPKTLLLHGFCEDSSIWIDWAESMTDWIAVDIPGFGSSHPGPSTIPDMVLPILSLLESLGVNDLSIIGHSLGGYLALEMAEQQKINIIKLALFHSHVYADTDLKKEGRLKTAHFISEHGSIPFLKTFFPALFTESHRIKYDYEIQNLIQSASLINPQGILNALQAMAGRQDKQRLLKSLAIPICFILGIEDGIIPLNEQIDQSSLPNIGMIEILKDTAHMGMIESAQISFNLVQKFLNTDFGQ